MTLFTFRTRTAGHFYLPPVCTGAASYNLQFMTCVFELTTDLGRTRPAVIAVNPSSRSQWNVASPNCKTWRQLRSTRLASRSASVTLRRILTAFGIQFLDPETGPQALPTLISGFLLLSDIKSAKAFSISRSIIIKLRLQIADNIHDFTPCRISKFNPN